MGHAKSPSFSPRRKWLVLLLRLLIMGNVMFCGVKSEGQAQTTGNVPAPGLLCISECYTCPEICSPPPSPPQSNPPVVLWPPVHSSPPPPASYLYKSPPPPPRRSHHRRLLHSLIFHGVPILHLLLLLLFTILQAMPLQTGETILITTFMRQKLILSLLCCRWLVRCYCPFSLSIVLARGKLQW